MSLPPVTAQIPCRWCDLAHSVPGHDLRQLLLGEDELPEARGEGGRGATEPESAAGGAFVALRSPSDGRSALQGVTLVPRKHVRTLTELPPAEMAEVLAGLSSAAVALEKLPGVDKIQIYADTTGPAGGDGHLRFRVEPVVGLVGLAGATGSASGEDVNARGVGEDVDRRAAGEDAHGRRRPRRGAGASASTALGDAPAREAVPREAVPREADARFNLGAAR